MSHHHKRPLSDDIKLYLPNPNLAQGSTLLSECWLLYIRGAIDKNRTTVLACPAWSSSFYCRFISLFSPYRRKMKQATGETVEGVTQEAHAPNKPKPKTETSPNQQHPPQNPLVLSVARFLRLVPVMDSLRHLRLAETTRPSKHHQLRWSNCFDGASLGRNQTLEKTQTHSRTNPQTRKTKTTKNTKTKQTHQPQTTAQKPGTTTCNNNPHPNNMQTP